LGGGSGKSVVSVIANLRSCNHELLSSHFVGV
jgi:hypothetical protein